MKVATMLCHPDTISGCSILDDGTRLHWTEGRSSYVDIRHPDGRKEAVPASDIPPMVRAETIEIRDMTPEEKAQHDRVRNGEE
jgi:hypothetical protein